MIESAVLGGLLGGITRMVPEVLNFFDRKNERKHELSLGDQQKELITIQGHLKLDSEQLAADSAQVTAGINAVSEAYKSMKTGFKFADTVSALVRPWVTFIIFHVYILVKVAAYVQLQKSGIVWETAVQTIWGPEDVTMLSGIVNFWFLGRVFEKKR